MRLFQHRVYKSGTEWCVWRWTVVPTGYIVRLHLLKTPWFALMVHWLVHPDPEPFLHDHPVTFLSVILHGGYWELRPYNAEDRMIPDVHAVRWFNYIRATDQHTITAVKPNTVTLCFVGPKVREWGFHTPDGWVFWKDYNRQHHQGTDR